ncbi:MAG: tryptophan synthase subunit alpha [Proteobacteria bacterium]|nr:tryptophan synthase subunit alpha [Pseudomonadota bacterium]
MSNKRIEKRFAELKAEGRAALVTYMMGCDPSLKTSLSLLKALPKAGADLIELGVPFTDPMADGPTIQRAAVRAFKAGATLKKILGMVKEFRKGDNETPLILMGYYNPIYCYGVKDFVHDALDAGVDGVIIVDLPPEEESEFTDIARPAGLSLVKLTTPTTDDQRAKVVLRNASGFVYYVSIAGVTGTKTANYAEVEKSVKRLKKQTKLPIAVGFGIKTPEHAKKVSGFADAVVVGSAFVEAAQKSPKQGLALISKIAKAVRA